MIVLRQPNDGNRRVAENLGSFSHPAPTTPSQQHVGARPWVTKGDLLSLAVGVAGNGLAKAPPECLPTRCPVSRWCGGSLWVSSPSEGGVPVSARGKGLAPGCPSGATLLDRSSAAPTPPCVREENPHAVRVSVSPRLHSVQRTPSRSAIGSYPAYSVMMKVAPCGSATEANLPMSIVIVGT